MINSTWLLQLAHINFWDEISMMSTSNIDTVDSLLRNLRKFDRPFGGCVMIFSGDFRQCLPIFHGHATVRATYKKCMLTRIESINTHQLQLTENMRIHFSNSSSAQKDSMKVQAKALLDVGTGITMKNEDNEVDLQDLSILTANENHFFNYNGEKFLQDSLFKFVVHINKKRITKI